MSLLTTSLPPASLQGDDVRVLDFRNRNESSISIIVSSATSCAKRPNSLPANRGTKSVPLLTTSLPPASLQGDEVRKLDLRNGNVKFISII